MQKYVKEKRLKFQQYKQSRCDEDKEVFREGEQENKEGSFQSKGEDIQYEALYKDLDDKLDSIEGQKMIYKLSKTRERRTIYLTDIG